VTRNAVDVLPDGALAEKLKLGRPLRVKLGIDVTAPDVTLGHAIPLQRMRAFQDAGHIAVLIVGDYTARVGDPSGRSIARQKPPQNFSANTATTRNPSLVASAWYGTTDGCPDPTRPGTRPSVQKYWAM